VVDAVPETADTIDELLRVAAEADAAVQMVAATASYAGDADPYRVSADEIEIDDVDDESDDDQSDADADDADAVDVAANKGGTTP